MSLGSHSSQNHQGEFLGLKAVWQGPLVGLNTTAVQCKATTESPGVRPPRPNQTWCLDAPTPAGTV